MARLCRRRPLGLLTDLDGTISPIVSTPKAAQVDRRCRSTLAALAERLDLVAVVSGRRAAEVRDMVAIPGVVCVGNHGLERWQDGEVKIIPVAERYIAEIASALALAKGRLGVPGLVFEDKGAVAAIHYRLAADHDQARTAILRAAHSIVDGLKLAEGKCVVEIRPPVAVDKGTALADMVAEHGLRAAIYLGDDLTDISAFRSLRRLRRKGVVRGLCVAVLGPETPERVVRAADYAVKGVGEVAQALEMMAERCNKLLPSDIRR